MLAFSYGDAKAITLGDVILFKNEQLAESNLKLWAHELTHVMQYQRWGIPGFAERYVRDSAGVEQEAGLGRRHEAAGEREGRRGEQRAERRGRIARIGEDAAVALVVDRRCRELHGAGKS